MKSATVALWMLLALPGCSAGAAQREDARGLDRKIARAMERGARRCAPAELATAQSHLEFFRYEASRGDSARAEAHRAQAEASIERALEIADPL
ncbi:MAG: OmpA family protein, partial [Myxococcota bacterium]